MILYLLAILYALSMIYILLAEFLYIISIFICRNRTHCQISRCPLRTRCRRSALTDDELEQLKIRISQLEENIPNKKPEN